MARQYHLPPSASSLSASMRDLGYSLETAVADLIDNSISADSSDIKIFYNLTKEDPMLAIIDNGSGMSENEVISAMRYGTCKQQRKLGDLGKFGLGLKTASFSQCRHMQVISKKNGILSGAEWNLDLVEKKDEWLISVLDQKDMNHLPYIEILGRNGTIVFWHSLDRLFENEVGCQRDDIVNQKFSSVGRHLSLVFHRYLSGDVQDQRKLSISINNHNLEAFDPFCLSNSATQKLPVETVQMGTSKVKIKSYILPHHNKLSVKEHEYYQQNKHDFFSNQGAYTYRNNRLMAWGDWFHIIPKSEATKLARVSIDFSSEIDEFWTIDIKKSRAQPPQIVQKRLRKFIEKVTSRSVSVHRGRGQRLFETVKTPIWERYAEQENHIRYTLCQTHPLIQTLINELNPLQIKKINLLLQAISSSLPIEAIYHDYSTRPRNMEQSIITEDQVIEKLHQLKDILFENNPTNSNIFKDIAMSTRLFDKHESIVEKFINTQLT